MNVKKCFKIPVEDQLKTLERALVEANKADCLKLQRHILSEIKKVQTIAGNNLEAEEVNQKLLSLGELSSESEDESEIVESTPNIGDSIDLDALSGMYC